MAYNGDGLGVLGVQALQHHMPSSDRLENSICITECHGIDHPSSISYWGCLVHKSIAGSSNLPIGTTCSADGSVGGFQVLPTLISESSTD